MRNGNGGVEFKNKIKMLNSLIYLLQNSFGLLAYYKTSKLVDKNIYKYNKFCPVL